MRPGGVNVRPESEHVSRECDKKCHLFLSGPGLSANDVLQLVDDSPCN